MTNKADYTNLYMRYLGVLKLLEECSPHVDDLERESIESAFNDACRHHSHLRAGRLLNRVTLEVVS